MSNPKGRPMALACATALVLAVPVSQAYVRAGSAPVARPEWNTFSADVTIRRGLRTAAQPSVTDADPAVTYRLLRTESGPFWKTTMTVVGATRADVVSPSGEWQAIPPIVSRIEDDGDGSEPRFYNLQGQLLVPPRKSDRQKMGTADSVFAPTDALTATHAAGADRPRPADGGRGWVEALMPSPDKTSTRRAALQKRFGNAVGKVRGLDRYLLAGADQVLELLVDQGMAVPIEINTTRGGVLQSHAVFVYESGPRGSLLRRRAHVEHPIPDRPQQKDARLSVDVEIANVALEDRR